MNERIVIPNYVKSINNVIDPTYLNSNFKHLYPPEKHGILCIQNN